MMHLRLPVLVALLAFLSAGCVVEAQDEGVDGSFERTIPLTGDADVSVTSRSGNIRVVAGASDQVHISARIRAFGNLSYSPSQQLDELESHPPIRVDGNSISIGEIDEWMLGTNVRISYEIAVPATVRLRTASRSGRQIITAVTGALDATSRSGSIVLEDVKGPLRLGSRSGNVSVAGVPVGEWEIETRSGDVSVRVPAASPYAVDIETRSGSIRTSRAIEATGTFRRKGFTGRVGSGGAPIYVDTRSGSIDIE
jgi:hypothetical protein